MSKREEIARRHGLPAHLAASLHGETPAEWEADAAARAALMRMFAPRRLDEEPPIENLAPADKSIYDYTPEEREAQSELTRRAIRDREHAAEDSRTVEQRHGDLLGEVLNPAAKRARDEALIRALHPRGDE